MANDVSFGQNQAVKKTSPREQEVTLNVGNTVATGYFDRENYDLVAIEVDSSYTGTSIHFGVTNDPDELALGLTLASDGLGWEGTLIDIDVTTYLKQSLDPAKFAGWRYIVPISDASQLTVYSVITGYFRSFQVS